MRPATATTEPPSAAVGAGPGGGEGAGSLPAAVARRSVPARAEGVELLGTMSGSGHSRPPSLVRRVDGQTIQLTPLLHEVLTAIDGRRDHAQIAEEVSGRIGKQAAAEDIDYLVENKLRPLGILQQADGLEPIVRPSNPLLALRWRLVVSNPRVTRRITTPFAALFHPVLAVPLLAVFAASSAWLLLEKGLGSATHQAIYDPGALLLVFALTMLSAGFHEFGHAAACRYGGATPGAMGVGLYLVWPAFYTDVTDSYRLGKAGRLRVDVGGLYFNAIVAVVVFAVWNIVRWDALLLIIPAQLLQMVRQLLPLVRFDGYHILADLTGVPDLFAHVKPTIMALLPRRWRKSEPQRSALKPWARRVVTAWVLLVIPTLLFALAFMVKVLPRVAATAADSLSRQADLLSGSWADGDLADVGVRLLAMFTIALPVASMVYVVGRVVRRTVLRVWRWSAGNPKRRAAAVLTGLAVLALVAWAWWPDGQYRPIERTERGALQDAVPLPVAPDMVYAAQAAPGRVLVTQPLFAQTAVGFRQLVGPSTAPVGATPRVGVILTPADPSSGQPPKVILPPDGEDLDPEVVGPPRSAWPFPFNPPRAAREHDNQALAVNTEDGTTLYDVSVALVWVTDNPDHVDHRNDAYALASCRDCTTIAVAFQVIFVVGQVDTYIPQNVAMAVNSDCVRCTTYALAVQLIATISDIPSADAMERITAIWEHVEMVADNIERVGVNQIHAYLASVEVALLRIMMEDDGASTSTNTVEETATEASTPDAGGETETPNEDESSEARAAGATEAHDATEQPPATEPMAATEQPPPSDSPTATESQPGPTESAPEAQSADAEASATEQPTAAGAMESAPPETSGEAGDTVEADVTATEDP